MVDLQSFWIFVVFNNNVLLFILDFPLEMIWEIDSGIDFSDLWLFH